MHSVVVKIGGSILFSSNSLDRLIKDIADQYPDSSLFVVVGGGELVEAILARLGSFGGLGAQNKTPTKIHFFQKESAHFWT